MVDILYDMTEDPIYWVIICSTYWNERLTQCHRTLNAFLIMGLLAKLQVLRLFCPIW